MHRIFCLIVALIAGTANASSVTIDFEELTAGTSLPSVSSQDFVFTDVEGALILNNDPGSGRDLSLYWGLQTGNALTMQHDTGSLFSLIGVDITTVNTGNPTIAMDITGYYNNGGSVTETVLTGDWLNFSFDTTVWTNLTHVEFSRDGNTFAHGIDQVVATVVPLPAAIWLFGYALLLLPWFRTIAG